MQIVVRISAVVTLLLGLASAARADDERAVELGKLCTSCHGSALQGNQDIGAPSIAGMPEWYLQHELQYFHDGQRGAHAKDINGMRMHPVGKYLDASDQKLVAHYVSGLQRPVPVDTIKGNVAQGDLKFSLCTTCHGPKGEGNQQVGAPPLVGGSDWYMLTQLKNFKAHIRGGDPAADPTGAAMAGIAGTLDDAGMVNVIAYINMLKPVK